ncbi:MAG TPA: alpha/beta hydrolase [Myxococcota bacterium]|nr:alpha/beta hydrolase [Myxococcota bacterium]
MSRPSHPFAPRTHSFAGADGLTLRADARGDPDAPPVLFLHGGGQTRHAWGGTAAALARDGRLAITLDLRGHGESDWATGDAPYRLERFAADLRAVIAQLAGPPALVGASLGGLTSLLAVGESTGPIASAAVLVDIAPRIEPEGAQRITTFMIGRPDGYASLDEVADAIADYTRQRSRPRDLASLKKNLRLGANGRWYWHWDPRFMGADGPAEIVDRQRLFAAARRLAFPTLLVRGRESDILSDEGVREFLTHLPNARYVDVGGAGHMVAGDRNDAFTEAVREFLARAVPVS